MQRALLCLALLAPLPACKSDAPPAQRSLAKVPTEVPLAPATDIAEATQYTVSFEDAAQHYIHVRAVFRAPADADVEFSMAVWTPGSYLVREYARHVEGLRVADASGQPLPATKSRKNRWRVHTPSSSEGHAGVIVEYKVYCNELSVRTNFVDADSAVLNGAPTFIQMVEDAPRAATVELHIPEGWKSPISGLDVDARAEGDAPKRFLAKNYDELVDSPIIAGRELVDHSFTIDEVPHTIAHLGDSSQWDTEEVLADVEQLARAEAHFWQVLPYKHYSFLNVILGGGGGLEHLDSTLMMAGPFRTRTGDGYRGWLGLVAHEFFHTWNIKRLRPKTLGPFDYENEAYTRSLWVAEGITSYYDDLLLRRAGLLTEEQYLERLSGQIRKLQTTPGRRVQPLEQSSYDAWIKHYRSDENSPNTAISYYTKGAVVAFLLDAEIRIASGGTQSLDTLMRELYARYSGEVGYTPEEFRAVASEVAGKDLSEFFAAYIDSTAELDYGPATEYFGLDLKSEESPDSKKDEDDDSDAPPAYLGLVMKGSVVRNVLRDTPGYAAGVNSGDEVIALAGYRLSGAFTDLLAKFRPGEKLTLTVARGGRLRELEVTTGKEPETLWDLEVRGTRSQLQRERYEQWIREYDNL